MRTLLIAFFISFSATGAVFTVQNDQIVIQQTDFKISEFVADYAKMKSMNVVFDNDFKDQSTTLVGSKVMPKTDVDLYLSVILMENGYTMLTVAETQTLNIVNSRDIRYRSAKVYKSIETLPDTFEHVWFIHTLKHIPANILARNLRPLVSRYGRVIDHSDSIMISDTAKNVKQLMNVVRFMDTADHLKGWEEIKQLNEKNSKVTIKSKGLLEILGENTVIFLILFCLIGGIIGFGTRGYLMKRIEGGW